MRRVSCLEVEVLGARAPVCKSEDVIIMYGLDCVCAMLIAQVKYNRVRVCVCVRERERALGEIDKLGKIGKNILFRS